MNSSEVDVITIESGNRYLINEFLSNAGSALRTFRYFQSRSIETIEQHLFTCVLSKKGYVIGYGHLDKEKENVWLGIAIIEKMKGKGCGRFLLKFLINVAREAQIETIKLSVDSSNYVAKKMYVNSGFKKFDSSSDTEFYKLQLQ